MGGYELKDFYQWDTPEDEESESEEPENEGELESSKPKYTWEEMLQMMKEQQKRGEAERKKRQEDFWERLAEKNYKAI